MSVEQAFSYVFTWFANPNACRKCRALHGREYRGQDLFAAQLVDPQFGPIWDLNVDVSLAHPYCKCRLLVSVNVDLSAIKVYGTFRETMQKFV